VTRSLKRAELSGRQWLVRLLALFFSVRRRVVLLPERPRILVVRLDERVGNLVLLTPLLSTLKSRFPTAIVDVLGYAKTRVLLHGHPAVSQVLAFDKRSWFSPQGPLRIYRFLKKRHYDLALDAANPTDPSFTQALITRFSGAKHTVGPARGPFERLYSAPAAIADSGTTHEIDLRLQLLESVPGNLAIRDTSLGSLGSPSPDVSKLITVAGDYGVVNLGARIREKWLAIEDYALLARAIIEHGLSCVLTWGAQEKDLAKAIQERVPDAHLAPPTDLVDLAAILRSARCVVTCDTGPMHVAVAVGAPTCAIFVSTDPARYGYHIPPHASVDRREPAWRTRVISWMREV
jgi:heptosyltransferase-3